MQYGDIVGQEDVVARLKGFGEFFASKGTTAGHILLIGEDGMGKQAIASIFAHELGVGFQRTDARHIQQQGDLTAIVTNLKKNQVLLLSNVQLLKSVFAERLLV